MYEIFRASDGLYIANGGQLVLKVMLNDLFMAKKICNLLNAAQQSVQPTVLTHSPNCALVKSLVADCNCGFDKSHSG